MMKLITIVASAALVSAGTNKTLAPTPGAVRPTSPAPITPFPTEPPQVRYICIVVCFILAIAIEQRRLDRRRRRIISHHHMRWCMM